MREAESAAVAGTGDTEYQSVNSYGRVAREMLEPKLVHDQVRHRWCGAVLLVHRDDVAKHGLRYGWTWKQGNLFEP